MAVDKRADIWSFGVVLFEMLTGRQLFSGPTVSDTMAAVLRADVEWSALPPDTPPAFAACSPLSRSRLQAATARYRRRPAGDRRGAGRTGGSVSRAISKEPWPWIAATVCALVAVAVSFVHFRETPPLKSVMRFNIPAPENTTGFDLASISPDGRQIAFVAQPRSSRPLLFSRAVLGHTRAAGSGGYGRRRNAILVGGWTLSGISCGRWKTQEDRYSRRDSAGPVWTAIRMAPAPGVVAASFCFHGLRMVACIVCRQPAARRPW